MENTSERELDLRERRVGRLIAVTPFALLAASTVLAFATGDVPWPNVRTLALVALTAVLLWTVSGRRQGWIDRPGVAIAFIVALVVMIAILGTISGWFAGFFGFTGYVYSWRLLKGGWRYLGVTATALATVNGYLGGPGDLAPGSLLLRLSFVVTIVVMVVVFSHLGEVTADRSAEREQMVRRLRETIRENEGLHAQLLVQAREAGVLDERRRIAREIHDTLAQGFVGIITQLQAAERSGAGGEWRPRVDNSLRLARENLTEARRSVDALGPAPLESAALPEALSDLTSRWARLHGVRADFTATGEVRPLRDEVAAALLRTVQEALANVAKHAGAERVGVTLSYMEDVVALDVRDDGVGFDPARGPSPRPNGASDGDSDGARGGFGLTSMRQRVAGLSGILEIESASGAGTAISVVVPAAFEGDPW
ncbi:sensor histidine kinase [Nocardiopsis sp. JB363]|uniref:sensor histidine kinase n=1 Tax=Nocardiopsis sp. JB363 TaxID=1434837 RepID=UPI000B364997|nr:sensor histidine kinase [Nocardiopsis sp. JB363]